MSEDCHSSCLENVMMGSRISVKENKVIQPDFDLLEINESTKTGLYISVESTPTIRVKESDKETLASLVESYLENRRIIHNDYVRERVINVFRDFWLWCKSHKILLESISVSCFKCTLLKQRIYVCQVNGVEYFSGIMLRKV